MALVDQIWNRACRRSWTQPGTGDRALGDLLLFHGAAMSGGIDDAIERLTSAELQDAARGFHYFGFVRVAEMVGLAGERFSGLDESAHEASLLAAQGIYASEVPDDSALALRFHRDLEANPSHYSPLP